MREMDLTDFMSPEVARRGEGERKPGRAGYGLKDFVLPRFVQFPRLSAGCGLKKQRISATLHP